MLENKVNGCAEPETGSDSRLADYAPPLSRPKTTIISDARDCIRIIQGRVSIAPQRNSNSDVLQSLRDLNRCMIRYLFAALEPPKMEMLEGEYDSELLDQGGYLPNRLTSFAFGMHGSWKGKAFFPVSANQGVGYNYFESSGTMVRKLSMDTFIDRSMLDNRPSFVIRYEAKNRGLVTQLFGEVRQLTSEIMLGMGIFDPTLGRLHALRRYVPFVMVGPCRPYACEQMVSRTERAVGPV